MPLDFQSATEERLSLKGASVISEFLSLILSERLRRRKLLKALSVNVM